MAYKLTWSPTARDDLHDIVIFIARDNPERAMSFGYSTDFRDRPPANVSTFGQTRP